MSVGKHRTAPRDPNTKAVSSDNDETLADTRACDDTSEVRIDSTSDEPSCDLVAGVERDVTVLFCDICGYTALAERLELSRTARLVSRVMEFISAWIVECDGQIIDYYGDGVLAMWNTPREQQPDHAVLASQAALSVQRRLSDLSRHWERITGAPLELGMSINSGPVWVGNTGSKLRFKYGPSGHTVNVAHRVEGAIKSFRVPILITEKTRGLLDDRFATRRLGRVRIAGLRKAVSLHELYSGPLTLEWLRQRGLYERGLAAFEKADFKACRKLLRMVVCEEHFSDMPTLSLLTQAAEFIKSPPHHFDGSIGLESL